MFAVRFLFFFSFFFYQRPCSAYLNCSCLFLVINTGKCIAIELGLIKVDGKFQSLLQGTHPPELGTFQPELMLR